MKNFRKYQYGSNNYSKLNAQTPKNKQSPTELSKPTFLQRNYETKTEQKAFTQQTKQVEKQLTHMELGTKFYPNSVKHGDEKNNPNQLYFKSKDAEWRGQNNSKGTLKDNNLRKEKMKTDVSEYDKLHEKLNFIETKISEMKSNLQKKREEKAKKTDVLQQDIKKDFISNIRRPEDKGEVNKQNQPEQLLQKLHNMVTQVPEHKQLQTFEVDPYSPRNNIYYVSEIVKAHKIQNSLARQHLINSLHILKVLENSKIPTKQEIAPKVLSLAKPKNYQNAKTIVFDLDETLIHCNQNLTASYDIKLPITFPTGEIIEAGINVRPNATEILKNLSEKYEIIVFTASHSCYANVVIDYLDPEKKYVHHRLFREHCYQSPENIYIKDLRVINRNLSDLVLIDNAAYSYAYQIDNGIPIIPYYHGKTDFQLKALQKYIQSMFFVKDVREVNRKTFKINRYRDYYNNPDKLVKQLYLENQS